MSRKKRTSIETDLTASRRDFLRSSIAAGGALVTGGTVAHAESDPAITDLQEWARYLGDGVDNAPYGVPSEFEKHVVRRHVGWLRPFAVRLTASYTSRPPGASYCSLQPPWRSYGQTLPGAKATTSFGMPRSRSA